MNGEVLSRWVSRLREGERNHGLFWAACRMSEAGIVEEAIVDVLGPAAMRIGLDADEIERTVRSAHRHTQSGQRASAAGIPSSAPLGSSMSSSVRSFR